MHINIGSREFLPIPGDQIFELPPLFSKKPHITKIRLNLIQKAAEKVTRNDLGDENLCGRGDLSAEDRRLGLAAHMTDQYELLVERIILGHFVLRWIRECEDQFMVINSLRPLVAEKDLWPHPRRLRFVHLLHDKKINPNGIPLEESVGLGITFERIPPLTCLSRETLYGFSPELARLHFESWTRRIPPPATYLPPERFKVQVVSTDL